MPPWTKDQNKLLWDRYAHQSAAQIGRAVGRSEAAVRVHASNIGCIKRERLATPTATPGRAKAFDWERFVMAYREACERRRISVSGAAKRLGIDATCIHRLMKGKGKLSVSALLLICDWAGLNPMSFLEDVADLPPAGDRDAGCEQVAEGAQA
jgi:hypothetical protein